MREHQLELRGRRREQRALDGVLRDVRAGRGRALVLSGAAGSGKTALLDHLAASAAPARVLRASGMESESEIGCCALRQLCAPLLGELDRLPEPQSAALRVAFGLSAGHFPELSLLGTATLRLVAAADAPLICVIDDAQWLDRLSGLILAFVARRLDAEPVGLVFATRHTRLLPGLPELPVEGLPETDARALLDSALTGPVDARVRDRIVAEAHGIPLALLEPARSLSPADLVFGFGGVSTTPPASRIEEGFRSRIVSLPADIRTVLRVAAVEPVGDAQLLRRALLGLGVGPEVVLRAQAEGLIEFGPTVRFTHPLVRSAVWRGMNAVELREVHRVLAEVADPARAPDRRAWHRAHAAAGPDDGIARELMSSADLAGARGGPSAAAAFLERASALTGPGYEIVTVDDRRGSSRACAAITS